MYKRVVREDNGKAMYYRSGRLIKKSSIPPHILATLEPQEEPKVTNMADIAGGDVSVVDESPQAFRPQLPSQPMVDVISPPEPIVELPQDVCIFCGQSATASRFLNGQKVALCQDDYQNKTTGETVGAMREFMQTKA